jgi:hypothetical protein
MATVAAPHDNSQDDADNHPQYTPAQGDPGGYVADLSLIDVLDHLEALRLFIESGAAVDERFDDAIGRADVHAQAMDIAADLCSLDDPQTTTISLRFDRDEVALLALAHSATADHYYDDVDVPDTAAQYNDRAQQLLLALAAPGEGGER